MSSVHLAAVADFFTCHEIFIGRELEEYRLEGVIVDLALLVQYGFICIGCEDLADEMVEMIQLVVAVHLTLDGDLCLIDQL